MLDYILFDERSWRDFIDYLRQLGLEPEVSVGDEGWLVALPEDLDEAIDAKIEACYDRLLDRDEIRIAAGEGEAHRHRAGVNVTLGDGRVVQAPVDPGLMRRLLAAVSPGELGEFVDAIVAAVENPDDRPLCQR
ncbi:MAG: hypothetical protein G8D61_04420 [gamma proteobacterium symbiont of Ctena orbiculata]|nr:hypothetical protein [Candidatus Thiodiazotropha sp. (ex Lucina pensylvanica)]MBT3062358.1 hypothetical protein [Candidatus Thiodiazotropha sp. (ex Lucina pensylvanica)]MBV2094692.1 hypothetical protein [Candidatus Thiodiazotropha sp. (ex Codakia orbicularis)]PUB73831.1 MAG: hypothetical protein DBO99_19400 [gamma proteobacterium symbiont of Ctena orbiculata]